MRFMLLLWCRAMIMRMWASRWVDLKSGMWSKEEEKRSLMIETAICVMMEFFVAISKNILFTHGEQLTIPLLISPGGPIGVCKHCISALNVIPRPRGEAFLWLPKSPVTVTRCYCCGRVTFTVTFRVCLCIACPSLLSHWVSHKIFGYWRLLYLAKCAMSATGEDTAAVV